MNERICSMPRCIKRVVARGWCVMHYTRWRKTGDPAAVNRTYVVGGRVCSFPRCGKPHDCQGLCRGHNAQRDAGKSLTPLVKYRRATDRDEQGRKCCRRCDGWFPVDAYRRRSSALDGLDAECGECYRARNLWKNYRITVEDYDRMLRDQGGGCAICGGQDTRGHEFSVDHDHACCPDRTSCGTCVRGLLCNMCNAGVGMFRDRADVLEAAAAYVRLHKSRRPAA